MDLSKGAFQAQDASGHTHSHCDHKSQYLVGDIAENPADWRLAFFNIKTGKEVAIVSKFPVYPDAQPVQSWSLSALTANYNRGHYHMHPHPHFTGNDRYICYTTNVRGSLDIALVSVDQLAAMT